MPVSPCSEVACSVLSCVILFRANSRLRYSSIVLNKATSGGGLFIEPGSGLGGHTASVSRCQILANVATDGGGLYLMDHAGAVLRDFELSENYADSGGAVFLEGRWLVQQPPHNLTGTSNVAARGVNVFANDPERLPILTGLALERPENRDRGYGPEAATAAVSISLVDPFSYRPVLPPLRSRPGHGLNLTLLVHDAYGQLVTWTPVPVEFRVGLLVCLSSFASDCFHAAFCAFPVAYCVRCACDWCMHAAIARALQLRALADQRQRRRVPGVRPRGLPDHAHAEPAALRV